MPDFEAATQAAVPSTAAVAIEFFSIQLGAAAGGGLFLGIGGTICEDEGLSQIDLGNHHVTSLDDAFAVIRDTIKFPQ
ncbi:hypothetical protein JQ600_18395 [Bradyrhizobium sp. AUGA SZCCT0176]|uniref:hypothetical protein n=1 Tax=Bradyrhizobium sp. AUGA SZCCT0176 TaxID=2807664 RepID=UPI001BAB7B07|nr:hypothetical protein [Bradyrhizobium sp. AUGA SZCCT0176]MBR1226902.1 hypothetical protein [Bradyrhizobium sp. AUGA SZCCT0176]